MQSAPVQSTSEERPSGKLNSNPGHAPGALRFIKTLEPDLRAAVASLLVRLEKNCCTEPMSTYSLNCLQ